MKKSICVNALNRAFPISTQEQKEDIMTIKSVSMPLIGLSPFLLPAHLKQAPQQSHVSMPLIGLSPFLQWRKQVNSEKYYCVNALNRAFPISTKFWWSGCNCKFYCVNALNRAFPISTVSLKKPAKINGFRVRFYGVIIRIF